jgi:hypothetical protein
VVQLDPAHAGLIGFDVAGFSAMASAGSFRLS